jgi:hypothetical protein
MLSREEYERIIHVFLVELNHLCLNADEKDLHALPRLRSVMDEYLEELRNAENNAAQVLHYAFGYIDEYIDADWERVASAGYEAYKITQAKVESDSAGA